MAQPPKPLLSKLASPASFQPSIHSLNVVFAQPPAPFSGLSSILPPSGTQVNVSGVYSEYKNAVQAISDRLAEDRWFLGSRSVSFSVAFDYGLTGSTANPQRWTPWCSHTYILFSSHHTKSDLKSPAVKTLWHGIVGSFIPFSRVS